MASIPKASDLAALSVAERLDLMDRIWESLEPGFHSTPVPDWHQAATEKELREMTADGYMGRPTEEVFVELKRKL